VTELETPAGTSGGTVDQRRIEEFVYREARLADEHDYDAWEALWTDDAIYWVPASHPDGDPEQQMSVIYDNRNRIATRLKQLRTGRRYSQSPPSVVRRVVSNVEVVDAAGPDRAVAANFVAVESRERGNEVWAGRTTYRLRPVDGSLRLSYKKVVLVNSATALPTLSCLILWKV
jgi:benzoate/toluate 1,2-dioxygenase beta subunit